MELAAAKRAALGIRSKITRAGRGMANVEKPRDPVEEWENAVRSQFDNLKRFAAEWGLGLTEDDLPQRSFGRCGLEHEVFHAPGATRFVKSTFPGQSGFGHFGFYTPAGYLSRLMLSNTVFGDDVEFEGVLSRLEGLSIVTSQRYVLPHPVRFIPSEEEIRGFLEGLDFRFDESSRLWQRDQDGVQLADTHDRNFIRTPAESIVAIDVQPRLMPGFKVEAVIPFPD